MLKNEKCCFLTSMQERDATDQKHKKSTTRSVKTARMMHRICIEGKLHPCFPCLVMDRDSKSRYKQVFWLARQYCLFSSHFFII